MGRIQRRVNPEKFSEGYFRVELDFEPYGGEVPVMDEEDLRPLLRATHTKEPLLVRVEKSHFPVYGERGVPHMTVAMPENFSELLPLDPPETRKVLIPIHQTRFETVFWLNQHG